MAEISVSSLMDSSSTPTTTTTTGNQNSNVSMEKFAEILDQQATNREYLIKMIDDLQITTSNSLKLQSTTLVQLTSSTNELTRQALVTFSFSFFTYPDSGRTVSLCYRLQHQNDVSNWVKHYEKCQKEFHLKMFNSSLDNFLNVQLIFLPFVMLSVSFLLSSSFDL